jgi:CheY-like chemotaxis protein
VAGEEGPHAAPTTDPIVPEAEPAPLSPQEETAPALVNEVGDDRDNLHPGDRVLLIIENDLGFARFLLDTGREKGFKGLVTSLGASALAMARDYKPQAITLDIFLPDIDGWRVLDRLKNDLTTRHVPVCVISTDDSQERALNSGAMAFVAKPIQSKDTLLGLLGQLDDYLARDIKSLLVVDADAGRRQRAVEQLGAEEVQVTAVADGPAALQMIQERRIDCIVCSAESLDLDAEALAEAWRGRSQVTRTLPLVIFGDGAADDGCYRRLCAVATVRRVHSPERLLDQVSFFLHRSLAQISEPKRVILEDLHQSNKSLAGKKVLIVDDDMRNIFALSTVLEEHEMAICSVGNGRDAIRLLQEEQGVDIVLMDIMMPEMDGFETMREIRKVPALKNLPIVAVTAKAMKGDREKCIEAGAWDYLAKPVDPQQMLAVLRAWLHR